MHNNPLELVEGTIWSINLVIPEGAYRYLGFKFATDGQDLESGFNENHTCTLDESEMSQTVWCVYGEMGPTTDNDETIVIPEAIGLHNYPNPFNPETTIVYQLPEGKTGELEICNIKGQRVRVWSGLNGSGSLEWDGRNESGKITGSGVYLAIVRAGNVNRTEKLILLK